MAQAMLSFVANSLRPTPNNKAEYDIWSHGFQAVVSIDLSRLPNKRKLGAAEINAVPDLLKPRKRQCVSHLKKTRHTGLSDCSSDEADKDKLKAEVEQIFAKYRFNSPSYPDSSADDEKENRHGPSFSASLVSLPKPQPRVTRTSRSKPLVKAKVCPAPNKVIPRAPSMPTLGSLIAKAIPVPSKKVVLEDDLDISEFSSENDEYLTF